MTSRFLGSGTKDHVMNARALWGLLFRFYVILLGLLVVSYPFQQPGSKARTITLFSGIIVIFTLTLLALAIRFEWEPF